MTRILIADDEALQAASLAQRLQAFMARHHAVAAGA